MIFGEIQVKMTVEEATLVNALLSRNEAMALKHNEKYDWYECPVCGKIASAGDVFCDKCGQRLDWENIAL